MRPKVELAVRVAVGAVHGAMAVGAVGVGVASWAARQDGWTVHVATPAPPTTTTWGVGEPVTWGGPLRFTIGGWIVRWDPPTTTVENKSETERNENHG